MGKLFCLHSDDLDIQWALKLVPTARREKAIRLSSDRARKESLAAGLLLCRAAAEYGEDPDAVCYDANGKPDFASGRVHFSLSHSRGFAVCAVSKLPVGVDAEKKRPANLRAADRCFCEEEKNQLMACGSDDLKNQMFTRIWPRKEAFGKADGRGLLIANGFCAADGGTYEGHRYFFSDFEISDWLLSVCTKDTREDFALHWCENT